MEYSMVGGYIKEFDNLLEVLDFSQDWGTWIPSGMSQVLLLGQTPIGLFNIEAFACDFLTLPSCI